ncbi:MAG: hypothetical protein ACOY3Z_05100 [Thermodesulfobacteriota bacterium]
MGRYLAIASALLVLLHLAGVGLGEFFVSQAALVAASPTAIVGGGILAVVALAVLLLGLGKMGMYSLAFVLARLCLEAFKLLVCVMAVSSLTLWFGFGIHFWRDGGIPIAVVLHVWLWGVAATLHLIDFNYPLRGVFVDYSVLTALCLALVWGISLATG